MRKDWLTKSALVGTCLIAFTGVASPVRAAAATTAAPPLEPGMARVWFLRPSGDRLYSAGADPVVYANGTSFGEMAANTDFFRDVRPGTYRFSVQTYGTPTGQSVTLPLGAGTQTYVEVEWAPRWELGYASSGRGPEDHAFAVFPIAPQVARAYLPTLTYRPTES